MGWYMGPSGGVSKVVWSMLVVPTSAEGKDDYGKVTIRKEGNHDGKGEIYVLNSFG